MEITDEMVERATKAYTDARLDLSLKSFPSFKTAADDLHQRHQNAMRAALTAALGDVEPKPVCEPLDSYPVTFHATEYTEGQFIPSEAALGDVEPSTDVSGEVWSIVLWAMRYPISADTTEERMAREEARASVAADKIMACIHRATGSDDAKTP